MGLERSYVNVHSYILIGNDLIRCIDAESDPVTRVGAILARISCIRCSGGALHCNKECG